MITIVKPVHIHIDHGMITIVKPVHDSMIQIRIMQHI